MKIALIDSNPKAKRYNVGLLKIGAMLKSIGHQCDLYQNKAPTKEYDCAWISTIFTFNIPHSVGLAREAQKVSKDVLVGGIAATLLPEEFGEFDVYTGILEEADQYAPDYSLLKTVPRYSITTTSRGCIRNCQFCMVNKAEPVFSDRGNWTEDIHRASKEIVFYDNNFLAKPKRLLARDIRAIQDICASGRITVVDFNQGLDCRLLTDEYAAMWAGIPLRPVRFAFDNASEDGHFQRAIKLMTERGYKKFVVFILWNYLDTPQDFYYRMKETSRLSQSLDVQVVAYPMRYQPITYIDENRKYVGKFWTEKQRRGFSSSLMYIGGTHGQISLFGKKGSVTPIQNFEFWFGRTADEFAEILAQDKIREHWKFKQGVYMAHSANTAKPNSWYDFWSEIVSK